MEEAKRLQREQLKRIHRGHDGVYLEYGWYGRADRELQSKHMMFRDMFDVWSCCCGAGRDAAGCKGASNEEIERMIERDERLRAGVAVVEEPYVMK